MLLPQKHLEPVFASTASHIKENYYLMNIYKKEMW